MDIIDGWLQRVQVVFTLHVQFSPHSACVSHISQMGLVRNLCSIHLTVVMILFSHSCLKLFVCLFLQDLFILSGILSRVVHCKEQCGKSQGKMT